MKKHSIKSLLGLVLVGLLTLTPVMSSAEPAVSSTDFNDGLKLYYDFEGDSSTMFNDKSGGGFDAFPAKPAENDTRTTDGVTATVSDGKTGYGKALDLPVTDGMLAIPDNFRSTVANTDQTISFWFKGTSAMAEYQTVLAFGDKMLVKKITFHATGFEGNPLCVWVSDATGSDATRLFQSETAVPSNDDQWHLYTLTITRGDTADALVFYVDGAKKAEKNDIKLPDYESDGLNIWNQIGRSYWNESPTGQFDELRVYNKALSENAIVELRDAATPPAPPEPADLTSDLKYHFSFDFDNVGRDSVSKNNILEETGEIVRSDEDGPLNNQYGKYATFDGVFTYGLITDDILSGITNEMTVSLWVKPVAIKPYVRLFDIGLGTKFFSVILSTSDDAEWGRIEAAMTTDGWFGQPGTTFSSAYNEDKTIKKGEWNHVAVTVKDKLMTVYVNGSAVCSTTNLVDFSDIGESSENYIGMSRFVQDALFEGSIDELRVYSRGFTVAEVGLLNAGETPANPDDGTGGEQTTSPTTAATTIVTEDTEQTETTQNADESPDTGDASPVTGAIAILVLAASAVMVLNKKKSA